MELPQAGEALAECARRSAQKARRFAERRDLGVESPRSPISPRRLAEARDLLQQAGAAPDRARCASPRSCAEPAREIGRREMRQIDDRQRAAQDLARLGGVAERWSRRAFASCSRKTLAGGGRQLAARCSGAASVSIRLAALAAAAIAAARRRQGPPAREARARSTTCSFSRSRRRRRRSSGTASSGDGHRAQRPAQARERNHQSRRAAASADRQGTGRNRARRDRAFQRWPAQ